MQHHSAVKKNEIMKFADKWMELEAIVLSEVTQTPKQQQQQQNAGFLFHVSVQALGMYVPILITTEVR